MSCFSTLNETRNNTVALPRCTTDGNHSHGVPRVLVFLAVGVTRALRVSATCEAALAAGFDLFLVHYDHGAPEYRANFSWYERVRFTVAYHKHTNYMNHLAHALITQPDVAAEVAASYTHLLLPDEDVRLPPAHALRQFAHLSNRMRVAIAQPLVIKGGAEEGEMDRLSYTELVARVDYSALRPTCEIARIVDWVEVMTPLVMTCTLFDLIARYHNDKAVTDYGLDSIWCHAAPQMPSAPPVSLRGPSCAIIDRVVFVHGNAHSVAYKSHEGIYNAKIAAAEQTCARRHFPRLWSGYRTLGCSSPTGALLAATEAERRNFTTPPKFPLLLPRGSQLEATETHYRHPRHEIRDESTSADEQSVGLAAHFHERGDNRSAQEQVDGRGNALATHHHPRHDDRSTDEPMTVRTRHGQEQDPRRLYGIA